jgi:pimeloyl-ACP methyl ester carboxylesterase
MKTAANRIYALARSLGIQKAEVVGHDIGLMVAYAYAAQFPWHFRSNGPTPEALVEGRERTYFEHYWNDFAADKTRSLPEADREAYTAAYSRPGRMRAGWATSFRSSRPPRISLNFLRPS